MNKLLTTLSILLLVTSAHAQTYTVKAANLPLSLATVEKIQDGEIDYEVKDGQIQVRTVDRYGDAHIHTLFHDGVSQDEALAILAKKKARLESYFTIERVIDAATLKLTNGERVRLIGIDCPESKPNDKARRDSQRTGQDLATITKMGQEATEFVKNLILEGKEVRLEFDVQKKDKYGRLLAYVFDEGLLATDFVFELYPTHYFDNYNSYFVNATIINAGYATPMTIPPNVKYADLFEELYKEARENKRGLWR